MYESLNSPREFLLGQLKIFCSFCSWAIIVSQVQMMFLIIPRWGEPNRVNLGESIAFKHPLLLPRKTIWSLGLCFKQTPAWCQGCWYEHSLDSKMPVETQCLSLFSVSMINILIPATEWLTKTLIWVHCWRYSLSPWKSQGQRSLKQLITSNLCQ